MADRYARLVRCFSAVFPEIDEHAIPTASVDSAPEWDSLASLTLVAVVEEEFGITIDDLDLVELHSFDAFDEYVRERAA